MKTQHEAAPSGTRYKAARTSMDDLRQHPEATVWLHHVSEPNAAGCFGIERTSAYLLAKNGQFPVPVIRVGGRWRVPVGHLLRALGETE